MKNIVVCCDGTGNEPKADGFTNVFELVGAMRRQPGQIVYYDPGLGTESAPGAQTRVVKSITKLLGMAFGFGLRKNIGDAYRFLMSHYEPGDRIYLFGFSRGAYTVRAVAGMLHTVGLLENGADNLLYYAIKKYTQQGKREWENIGSFKGTLCRKIRDDSPRFSVPVHFLGVWDTVKSVGLFRGSVQLPYTSALPNVLSARHAVALDEKRSKFRPDLWTATGGLDGDVQTMWFRGVHSDVGGGYPATERGLADSSLDWMVDGAAESGLKIDQARLKRAKETRLRRVEDQQGTAGAQESYQRIHNSLLPCWWALGWRQRQLPERAWVHVNSLDSVSGQQAGWLASLGEEEARIEDGLLMIRFRDAVLIQTLSPGERKHLQLEECSNDPQKVLHQLRVVGVSLWHESLTTALAESSLSLSEASKKKAFGLLEAARKSTEANEIKGAGGGLAHLRTLLRMRSLKRSDGGKSALELIIPSAPHLIESLSECPVDPSSCTPADN